jgi:cysteine-rich repeat protein
LQCELCDYQMDQFVNNESKCEQCSLSHCVNCFSLTECEKCTEVDNFHLNNETSLCELCTLEGCTNCTSLHQCAQCDESNNFFLNESASVCQRCAVENCLECSALTVCETCDENKGFGRSNIDPNICGECNESCLCDGYHFPWKGTQCSSLCGDGLLRLEEQCDDNNTEDGDGCASDCTIERFHVCSGEPSDCTRVLFITSELVGVKSDGCNGLIVTLRITDFNVSDFDMGEIAQFVRVQTEHISIERIEKVPTSSNNANNVIDLHLQMQEGFEGNSDIVIVFEPGNQVTVEYSPFVPPVHYTESECQSAEQIGSLLEVMQVFSYFTLIVSVLSCKIVGLELFGVLQLAYFTLGSHDFANIYLAPLAKFKTFNGLNLMFLEEPSSENLPLSLSSISVHSNFLNNCNIMLILLVVELFIGIILWIVGRCIRIFRIHHIGSRLLKQGFVTLLLFNLFNIGYSVGIHFLYAEPSDEGYVFSVVVIAFILGLVFWATVAM